jgi:hypothetical protein
MDDPQVRHVTNPPPNASDPEASVGNAGFVGHRWRLVQISRDDRVTNVPGRIDASIEFAADNWVLVNDTVNVASGPFTPVPGGYRIAELPQSAVAYGGHDPLRKTVIDEMLALNRAGTVAASVFLGSGSPGRPCLRLTTPAPVVSLVFEQDGEARTQLGPGAPPR